MHHPFTRPKAEDMPLFEAKKFREVRAEAYDVVLNGVEIGGGSMRIYEPELQEKMFEALGIRSGRSAIAVWPFAACAPTRRAAAWRHRVRPRSSGHADLRRTSIRDVMAFPKNNRGMDLMTNSPAEVDPRQLRDLGIKLTREKK